MAAAVTVGTIAAKLRGDPDDAGEVCFAIVADVTNHTRNPVEVSVDIQAVDDEGFELMDLTLRGPLGPGETRRLSDQDYMRHKDYLAIAKWQVEEVSVDEPY